MKQRWWIALAIGVLICGALAVGALGLLARTVSWRTLKVSDVTSELQDTLEMFVDQEIESGFADPEIDFDDPVLLDRKIFLSQEINGRSAKDVSVRLFFLNSVDKAQPIDLYISTQGGWGDNAFAIIDAMRLIEAPVNTWAVGGCYSSGALVLAAGTGRRVATENAIIMIHANLDDSSEDFSLDRLALARYENLWRKTTELPSNWYPMTSDKQYYLSPEDALRLKVVDAIFPRLETEFGGSSK